MKIKNDLHCVGSQGRRAPAAWVLLLGLFFFSGCETLSHIELSYGEWKLVLWGEKSPEPHWEKTAVAIVNTGRNSREARGKTERAGFLYVGATDKVRVRAFVVDKDPSSGRERESAFRIDDLTSQQSAMIPIRGNEEYVVRWTVSDDSPNARPNVYLVNFKAARS